MALSVYSSNEFMYVLSAVGRGLCLFSVSVIIFYPDVEWVDSLFSAYREQRARINKNNKNMAFSGVFYYSIHREKRGVTCHGRVCRP